LEEFILNFEYKPVPVALSSLYSETQAAGDRSNSTNVFGFASSYYLFIQSSRINVVDFTCFHYLLIQSSSIPKKTLYFHLLFEVVEPMGSVTVFVLGMK